MRVAIPLFVAASIVGCTASSDYEATQLSGVWGGDLVEVRDSTPAHSTIVQLACHRFAFPDPLAVDSAGHFSAPGSSIAQSNYPATPTTMTGQAYRDSLVFVLHVPAGLGGSAPATLSFTAYPRRRGDFKTNLYGCAT